MDRRGIAMDPFCIWFEFNLTYLWIGVSWRRQVDIFTTSYDVKICLLPCFPIHLSWERAGGQCVFPAD